MGIFDRIRRGGTATPDRLPEADLGRAFVTMMEARGIPAGDLAKAVRVDADGRTITDLSQLARTIQGDTGAMGAPFAAGAEWQGGGDAFAAAGMGPGWPAMPFPLGGEPRQWQYRPGFNFPSPPDVDRGIDARLLRTLADSYDLLRQCIEVCKNDIAALSWDVVPREKNRKKREAILESDADEIGRIKQFFEWPEAYMCQDAAGHWVRRGRTGWQQWIKAQLEEFYVGDWLTIWPREMRNGQMLAFERVDGSTIKPLVDTEGRQPPPPLPAWQQYLYGVPRASFTLDELLYRPYTPRNFTVYGYSHVEQMLLLINLALRFQMWNQQAYTDGALPLGVLSFPEGWTPEQIKAITDQLNMMTSGLSDSRQQWHGVPFGVAWQPIKPFEWDASFASYLIEYTCALFGLNAMRLGFMPGRSQGSNSLGGSGFAEQQQEAAQSSEKIPTARWVEGLMNELLDRCLGRPDLEFQFIDLQEQDEQAQLEADQLAVQSGAKSWDQMLQERGEDPVGVSEPFIIAPGGQIYSVADIKAIQEGGQRNPAPGIPMSEDDLSRQEENDAKPPPPMVPPGGGVAALPPGGKPDAGGDGAKPEAGPEAEKPSGDDEDAAKTFDLSSGMQPHGLGGDQAAELRRWKRKAVKDARAGRRPRPFETDVLPETVKAAVADELSRADDVLDVRVVFDQHIADLEKAARADRVTITLDGRGLAKEAAKTGAPTVAGLCVRAADTGRILMLQRSITDPDDPARGTWEFPGGHLETGEDPLAGAIREWQEETGIQLPSAVIVGSFLSGGIYECFICVVPAEADVPLNLDPDHRTVINPDDPDGDDTETLAWWAPSDAETNPALRRECKDGTDWKAIGAAVPDAEFKLATVLVELGKAAQPQRGDTDRERRIKEIAAAAGAALAVRAAAMAAERGRIAAQVNDMVSKLASHYRQAVAVGSRDAAVAHGVAPLSPDAIDELATARAEAQRANITALVQQARTGDVSGRAVGFLARGAKPAYEHGYAAAVTGQHPDAQCVWHVMADDPCENCEPRDGEVFTTDTLPGYPGDGDFGGDLCLGGPNDRCELEWIIPTGGDSDAQDDGGDDSEFAAKADLEKVAPEQPLGAVLLERTVTALEKLADRPPDTHLHHVDVQPGPAPEVHVDARSEHHHEHRHEHHIDVAPADVTFSPEIKVEQPRRGPVRIEKRKDGSTRLVPEDEEG